MATPFVCTSAEKFLTTHTATALVRFVQQHAEWIILEGRVSGMKKAQILSRQRFGIQTRSAEPFGISVAEMVKAGAIVFAPNDGGQAEILNHSDLLFANEDRCRVQNRVLFSTEVKKQLECAGIYLSKQAQFGIDSHSSKVLRADALRNFFRAHVRQGHRQAQSAQCHEPLNLTRRCHQRSS